MLSRPRTSILLVPLLLLLIPLSLPAQVRDIVLEPTRIVYQGKPLYERSWAVLIGINEYQHPRVPRLEFAVNDVRNMRAALLRLGFQEGQILELTDRQATKRGIEDILGDRLRRLVGREDRVLIFFAGHGKDEEVREGKDEGYLVPHDGDPERLYSTAISMSALVQIAERLRAKHVLFTVDACYSGFAAFKGRAIVNPELVEDLTRRPAVQVLTAGRKGELAQEKEGQGLFTGVLIKGLEGQADRRGWGWVSLDHLGEYVRDRVYAESGRRQYPQFGNLAGEGQFVFVLASEGRLPLPPTPVGRGDLYVSSEPAGATIYLDGRDSGKTTPALFEGIPTGSRRVELRKGEYMVASGSVTVEANTINRMGLKLEVLKGQLKVVSEPLEAEVFVDGERVGRTPLIAAAPGGARTVKVEKKGYEPFEKKVEVSIREPNSLMAVLVPRRIPEGMVEVPAGEFIMGDNHGDGDESERPSRRVYLEAFYIDKYPITNEQYRKFTEATGHRRPEYKALLMPGEPSAKHRYVDWDSSKFNAPRQPVVGVSWHDAQAYCRWAGKRLPTEAEWEKAARGPDGRKYPWGNEWDPTKAIFGGNSGLKTHPVDRTYNTHRSPYGAVDMAGNVFQWVADWYDEKYYAQGENRNPRGPSSGQYRVLRGGSWLYSTGHLRAPQRFRTDPTERNLNYWHFGDLGFRCAGAP